PPRHRGGVTRAAGAGRRDVAEAPPRSRARGRAGRGAAAERARRLHRRGGAGGPAARRGGGGHADPATVLEAVLAATGYEQYLAEEGAEGIERIENVRELIAGAAAWAEVQDPQVAADGGGSPVERYLTQAALV